MSALEIDSINNKKKPLTVKVAKSAGFCFGVKRAVQMVYDEAERNPGKVYTMGPIIHNEQVVEDLARRGVGIIGDDLRIVTDMSVNAVGSGQQSVVLNAAPDQSRTEEADRGEIDGNHSVALAESGQMPPEGSVIIVRSHGISRQMTERLERSGYRIVTATCPFVQKIHDIVAKKSQEGYGIVIVGNPGHPEVVGIRGWALGPCEVVENYEDARNLHLPKDRPVWIVSQTTFNYEKFQDIVDIIIRMGYNSKVTNTICNATKERQTESLELAAESDVMIVIGGKNSSNTQKLYDICKSRCGNTYHIQTLEDMSTVQFHNGNRVGITAGASTPNTIIQEVSTHVRGTEL